MSGTGFNLIRGRVMRVTKLDGCGNRILGPDSEVTTDGFISIGMTAQTTQGDAITVVNAAGNNCVSDTPAPKFTGYQVTTSFCGVFPELLTLMTGQPVIYAADGTTVVGIEETSDVDLTGSGFALEVWSSVPTAQCTDEGATTYGYFLMPFMQGGVQADVTIQNDAINFGVQNALTKDGQNWGVGLYDVVPDVDGDPSPLNTALRTNSHRAVILTTVPPPDPDGVGQVGVPATSAVAGIPGHYAPTNAYGRADLAAMTGLTASPSTAWTTGQYVVNRDGSKAHWNSTAWVTGAA